MIPVFRTALTGSLAVLLAVATAHADTKKPTDKPVAAVPEAARDSHPRWSSWPKLPERQGGRSYSKLVRPEYGGPVERNFESGRN